jgi:hypothetical protein
MCLHEHIRRRLLGLSTLAFFSFAMAPFVLVSGMINVLVQLVNPALAFVQPKADCTNHAYIILWLIWLLVKKKEEKATWKGKEKGYIDVSM